MTQDTYSHEFDVEQRHSADALGNDGVEVLGTPFLLLFMELTSQYLIEKIEGDGTVSVGISADFRHLAATPVGAKVSVTARLIAQDRARYSFEVEAHDAGGLIGKGGHERFRVDDLGAFLAKSLERSK